MCKKDMCSGDDIDINCGPTLTLVLADDNSQSDSNLEARTVTFKPKEYLLEEDDSLKFSAEVSTFFDESCKEGNDFGLGIPFFAKKFIAFKSVLSDPNGPRSGKRKHFIFLADIVPLN